MAGRGVAEEDLRQVAFLAILRAVERFDPERGVSFATFANRTINGELRHYMRDRTWSVRSRRLALPGAVPAGPRGSRGS